MVGLVVFLGTIALCFGVWGLSKFSKWLERINVPAKVFYSVMAVLMLALGGSFLAVINLANHFA